MPSPAVQPTPLQNPLALLRRLEWRVRHAVENVLSGEYRSAFRGRGMEFDQVVKYSFGDDVRLEGAGLVGVLGAPAEGLEPAGEVHGPQGLGGRGRARS